MRYPEFLNEGGRIGYVAPSFGPAIEPYRSLFSETMKFFENEGYKNVLGPNVYATDGEGKSSTPEKCGAEINDFFANDKCDIILSCGGGETMCEDLPFIDFEMIRAARPKWYMGYSDNTNLTYTLPVLCDTAAIYGSCASEFGMKPWHVSLNDAYDLLRGKKLQFSNYEKWEIDQLKNAENPFVGYNATEPFKLSCYVGSRKEDSASFEGRLLGGCLDVLQCLCGTKYDRTKEFIERYKDDKIIWFLEACDLPAMGVRRALWQLQEAGWFENAGGFIFGRPMLYDDCFGDFDQERAVTGILDKYNVPVVMNLDFGHLPPRMPIISGAYAHIEVWDNSITLRHELV